MPLGINGSNGLAQHQGDAALRPELRRPLAGQIFLRQGQLHPGLAGPDHQHLTV